MKVSKPRILFFARGYQTRFYPNLVDDAYEAVFVTLTSAEKRDIEQRGLKVVAQDLGRLGSSPLATVADLVDSETPLRGPGSHAGNGVGPVAAQGSVGILVLRHGHAVLNEKKPHSGLHRGVEVPAIRGQTPAAPLLAVGGQPLAHHPGLTLVHLHGHVERALPAHPSPGRGKRDAGKGEHPAAHDGTDAYTGGAPKA